MIEMSAATVPALAQPGAILAAAPAPASSEGAQSADFSAVLAGAALVAQMPEPATAPEPEPQTPAPISPELIAASAKHSGKSGASGKEDGKMLPPGKLPLARAVAVSSKAQRVVATDDAEDAPVPAKDAAPVTLDAPVRTAGDEQAPADTPVQTAPAAPTPIVIQQTATALQERTIPHEARQTEAEPAPARPANIVTRQNAASRLAATPIPAAEQAIAAASPSPAPTVAADVRLASAANTLTAMLEDTDAAPSQVMPAAEVPTTTSPETNVALLRSAIPSHATSGPSKAATTEYSVHDAVGSEGHGTAPKAAVITQTVRVASTLPTMAAASIPTSAPLVSTKAALVATTATNLPQPDTTQPSAIPAPSDGNVPVSTTDRAAPGLAHTAVGPALTAPSAPVFIATPASSSPALSTPILLSVAQPTPAVTSLMGASTLQAAPSAIVAPVQPVSAETVQAQASGSLTIAAATSSVASADQGKPAEAVAAPVVQSTRDGAAAGASLPAQPSAQTLTPPLPATIAAPLPAALPVAAPEVAIQQQAAAAAPVQAQPRTEPALAIQPAMVAAEPAKPAEHKRPLPVAAIEAPAAASRPEPISIVTGNDMRTAAIFAAPVTPAAATTPTQDIAALVDRINEARAAAAPDTIRAALMHEDFGSVSLNFRNEASHIHVTLGSADPGFAPAVQAAAAANLASGSDDAQHRREAPAPQSQSQPQDAARNDSASQQQAQRDRTNAGERQPSRQAPGRQPASTGERPSTATNPHRRSGIYA